MQYFVCLFFFLSSVDITNIIIRLKIISQIVVEMIDDQYGHGGDAG